MMPIRTSHVELSTDAGDAALTLVHDHFGRSAAAAERFFETDAAAIAGTCRRMAERFLGGGALFVFGEGPQATDAQHVAVEFVHPVIVGKRALGAVALTTDTGLLTGRRDAPHDVFSRPLGAIGRPGDIAMAIAAGDPAPAVRAALDGARAKGMLTVLLSAGAAAASDAADCVLRVRESDPYVVQEVQETAYHVLWELVHVFLERHGGLPDVTAAPASDDYERALYPFLFDTRTAPSDDELMDEVIASTKQKCTDVCRLRRAVEAASATTIAAAGVALATAVKGGGRVLAFGNGGSATDAQDAAVDCMLPQRDGWRTIPALALTNDVAVVTALGNDVGFEHVFARQVAAHGRPGDVALGFSTSGTSRNVLTALAAARARGLLTLAFSGYDGGEVARGGTVDYCVTAGSDYVPRIQEAHATAWHAILSVAQAALAADAPELPRARTERS